MEVQTVDIDSLHGWPGNPKLHDLDLIADSMNRYGQFKNIVVQESTRRIVAGNGTWQAAKNYLSWKQISAVLLDVDDETAARIVAMDNKAHDAGGGYDTHALRHLLTDLAETDQGLAGTGYSGDELDDLIKLLDTVDEGLGDGGDAEEEDLEPVWGIVITCTGEDQQSDLLKQFDAEGLEARPMIG